MSTTATTTATPQFKKLRKAGEVDEMFDEIKVTKTLKGQRTFDITDETALTHLVMQCEQRPKVFICQLAQKKGGDELQDVLNTSVDITRFLSNFWQWQNKDAIQQYFSSASSLKKLKLKKTVPDLPRLCSHITHLVRHYYPDCKYRCWVRVVDHSYLSIYPRNTVSLAMRSDALWTAFFIGGVGVGAMAFEKGRRSATKTFTAEMRYHFTEGEEAIWRQCQNQFVAGTKLEKHLLQVLKKEESRRRKRKNK
ncbi:hypothetical protein QOT17_009026 [Balamuthia mandrillaris]